MRRVYQMDHKIRIGITPLIDVTFLLLIFFMCAMKFKTLDMKLETHLPKDWGTFPTDAPPQPEKLRIVLLRDTPESPTEVTLFGRTLGTDEEGFRALDEKLEEIAVRMEGKLPLGEIRTRGEIPFQDTVRCVDSLVLGGAEEVWFEGAREKR